MRKTICKILEKIFPGETNRIKAERSAKRTAMQRMLDADHALRANGYGTDRINAELRLAMSAYAHGKYGCVAERIL